MVIRLASMLLALATIVTGGAVQAADWGDLSLTLTYDGAPPEAKKLDANKDQAVCGKMPLFDESLVVNSKNKGLANVVVTLYLKPGSAKPAVHPDYEKTAKDEVVMDNLGCRFEPHITILRSTQTLVLQNSDPIAHNIKADLLNNPPFNPIIPGGAKLKQTLKAEERLPVPVSCSIHPWMQGRLMVRDNPYFAVSDKEGKVEIKNLPAGKWTFQFWHEVPGFVQEAKQGGKAVKWAKGRMENVTIKAGANDLGTFAIPASVFKAK